MATPPPKLPTIFIARHGERLDFVDPTYRSTAALPDDAPLTERGERQAADLGRRLRDAGVTTVLSSPFQRCVRTASFASSQFAANNRAASSAPVAEDVAVGVSVDAGICEWLNVRYYSHTDGAGPEWRPLDTLAKEAAVVDGASRLRPPAAHRPTRPHAFGHDGYPETRQQFLDRCVDVVRELRKRALPADGGNVLLLGHGSSVEGLIRALVPGTEVPQITYCCLTECIPNEDGTYRIGKLCDTSFLAEPEHPENTRYN